MPSLQFCNKKHSYTHKNTSLQELDCPDSFERERHAPKNEDYSRDVSHTHFLEWIHTATLTSSTRKRLSVSQFNSLFYYFILLTYLHSLVRIRVHSRHTDLLLPLC